MRISNSIVQALLKNKDITIEYNGTHNSDPKNPLYGRKAYWRVWLQGHGFACKITAPVKSINPKQSTLDKLLFNSLRERLEAIDLIVDTDHCGQVLKPYEIDPYGVKCLLNSVSGKYINLMREGKQ